MNKSYKLTRFNCPRCNCKLFEYRWYLACQKCHNNYSRQEIIVEIDRKDYTELLNLCEYLAVALQGLIIGLPDNDLINDDTLRNAWEIIAKAKGEK